MRAGAGFHLVERKPSGSLEARVYYHGEHLFELDHPIGDRIQHLQDQPVDLGADRLVPVFGLVLLIGPGAKLQMAPKKPRAVHTGSDCLALSRCE